MWMADILILRIKDFGKGQMIKDGYLVGDISLNLIRSILMIVVILGIRLSIGGVALVRLIGRFLHKLYYTTNQHAKRFTNNQQG